MSDTELRCGNCRLWVGESAVKDLIVVDVVDIGTDIGLSPPRDLRLCKRCGKITVFVPREDLDARRSSAVA